jgi:micrococcal nuclease
MFEYNAIITSVYDGDTVRADIDLGFGIWIRNQPLRIHGIDAPEMGTPEGLEARDFARGQLQGKTVKVKTLKDAKEKYGRYLAIIELPAGEDFASLMIAANHAKPYFGGTR